MTDIIAGLTILVDDRKAANPELNAILSQYGGIIAGRMGIPHLQGDRSVITLILQGDETAVDSMMWRYDQDRKGAGLPHRAGTV